MSVDGKKPVTTKEALLGWAILLALPCWTYICYKVGYFVLSRLLL